MDVEKLNHIPPQKPYGPLFGLCLFISILLHLVLAALLHFGAFLEPAPELRRQQPTMVRLVDKPAAPETPLPPAPKPRELELDIPPSPAPPPPPEELPKEPEKPPRLADRDQRVTREQAPEGHDSRDQTAQPESTPQVPSQPATPAPPSPAAAPAKPPAPSPASPRQSAPAKSPGPAVSQEQQIQVPPAPEGQIADTTQETETPPESTASKPTPAPKDESQSPSASGESSERLPTLAQLTQLTPATITRSQARGREERIKEREGVEKGDTVWLNLEKGLLISFFRRFRNQIEGVWNYPVEAARNEIQGTLLLKITVNREGELQDVELLSTSGSDILDYEAIEAVYRSAPYGPLPKQYPHPELKIFAHFRYVLTGKYIFGR